MEGFDSEWINIGTRRYASYTNLDPGDYIFRVIGSNNDDVLGIINGLFNTNINSSINDNTNPLDQIKELDAFYGWSIGFDIGFLIEKDPLIFGLVLKDIGNTEINYQSNESVKSSIENFLSGTLPKANKDENTVGLFIPMRLQTGFAFNPDFGITKNILDPLIHLNYELIYTKDYQINSITFDNLHLGTKITVYKYLDVLAGVKNSKISIGCGIHLPFVDLSVGYFTVKKHINNIYKKTPTISFEAAIRM